MTDPDLIAKKLAFIETCVRELGVLGRPDLIGTDVKERRFVEHTLQIAIQAVIDVASHIVSDERLGEPRTNRELVVHPGNIFKYGFASSRTRATDGRSRSRAKYAARWGAVLPKGTTWLA